MKKIGRLVYWIIILVAFGFGVWAFSVRIVEGLKSTGLTSFVPWGLWVAFYIYFIGLSAGSFLLSTMIFVFGMKRFERAGRIAVFTALITLVTGMLFIVYDLGHIERFWTVFFNVSLSSILEVEIFLYVVYAVLILGELFFLMRQDLVRLTERNSGIAKGFYRVLSLGTRDISERSLGRDMSIVRVLGAIGIPIALGVHGGTGAIFGVVKAQPFWYTGLFPIIFIISALASGGGLVAFIYSFFGKKEPGHSDVSVGLARMAAGFVIFDMILLFSETLITLYGKIPEHVMVFKEIAFGRSWWAFWILQLVIGAIIPIIIIYNKNASKNIKIAGFAALLITIGILGARWNIVSPSLTVPQIMGKPEAFIDVRLSTIYTPTLIEWVSSLGIVSLSLILLTIGFYLLPLKGHLSSKET